MLTDIGFEFDFILKKYFYKISWYRLIVLVCENHEKVLAGALKVNLPSFPASAKIHKLSRPSQVRCSLLAKLFQTTSLHTNLVPPNLTSIHSKPFFLLGWKWTISRNLTIFLTFSPMLSLMSLPKEVYKLMCKICLLREIVPYTIISWTLKFEYHTLETMCVSKQFNFHKTKTILLSNLR